MTEAWWTATTGPQLAQGDLLPDCVLPVFATADPSIVSHESLRAARLVATQ